MPMYEFECQKGHVSEELVSIGTQIVECSKCDTKFPAPAFRILSPTRTNFEFADQRRKRSIE